jgi:hypothetical protein
METSLHRLFNCDPVAERPPIVTVGFNPRIGCRSAPSRRVATIESSLRDDPLVLSDSRGLKPTATVISSLRDGRNFDMYNTFSKGGAKQRVINYVASA